MSKQPEINTNIIDHLGEINTYNGRRRFILVGSLARGVLLGNDVLDLTDNQQKHFQDVDVVDRSGERLGQYDFMEGTLDTQTTQTIRPISVDSTTWGFFDNCSEQDVPAEPISTFDETDLGLEAVEFSRQYPGSTVLIPSIPSMLFFSDYMQYSHNMPKHRGQIRLLKDQVSNVDIPEGLDWAYKQFTEEMKLKYASKPYTRARRIFFNFAPKIAYGIQQTQIGVAIRKIRGVDERQDTPLNPSDL